MSVVRFAIGLLFISALLLTSGQGIASELDQQIAERARQYQESLRQRAAKLSPSFQSKIESQSLQTVACNMEKWNNGKVNIRIALPRWAEYQRFTLFVARHFPFSGGPDGSHVWEAINRIAALTVIPVSSVLKLSAIHAANFVPLRSVVPPSFWRGGVGISHFIRVAETIVLRQ